MSTTGNIEPFEVAIPDAVLDDLARRLERTRWPQQPESEPWVYGADLDYVQRVVRYWRERYDWRASERRINRFANFKSPIEGLQLHFILERGSGVNARPLLLTHGWPGSIVEFFEVIEPLAHPERFGGDEADAFTVVVPSIPGYGFSESPRAPIAPRDVARMLNTLMIERLGFETYLAEGGDWGGIITSWLGNDYPDRVVAMHLTLLAQVIAPAPDSRSAEERDWEQRNAARRAREAGYRTQQATRPHTLAYSLTDSPAGLAAWILEKFYSWTVFGDDRDPPFDPDALLTNVMLYWLAGPGPPSWLYVHMHSAQTIPGGRRIEVPTSFLFCPRDISEPPPDSVIERAYNMVRRTDAADGGHFVAFEQPELFVSEVREALRPYR